MEVETPKWLKVLWIIVMPGLLLFIGRMTYEYIYLTYTYGQQMIGFSLIHLYPYLFIYMLFSFFASICWTII